MEHLKPLLNYPKIFFGSSILRVDLSSLYAGCNGHTKMLELLIFAVWKPARFVFVLYPKKGYKYYYLGTSERAPGLCLLLSYKTNQKGLEDIWSLVWIFYITLGEGRK